MLDDMCACMYVGVYFRLHSLPVVPVRQCSHLLTCHPMQPFWKPGNPDRHIDMYEVCSHNNCMEYSQHRTHYCLPTIFLSTTVVRYVVRRSKAPDLSASNRSRSYEHIPRSGSDSSWCSHCSRRSHEHELWEKTKRQSRQDEASCRDGHGKWNSTAENRSYTTYYAIY